MTWRWHFIVGSYLMCFLLCYSLLSLCTYCWVHLPLTWWVLFRIWCAVRLTFDQASWWFLGILGRVSLKRRVSQISLHILERWLCNLAFGRFLHHIFRSFDVYFCFKSYVTKTLVPITLFYMGFSTIPFYCVFHEPISNIVHITLSLSNLPVGLCVLLLIILAAYKFMMWCFFISCSKVMLFM